MPGRCRPWSPPAPATPLAGGLPSAAMLALLLVTKYLGDVPQIVRIGGSRSG
ncbi:hypothetical protein [Haloferula sargassicola]|uniref:Uncharacterized protein n=1 Tax=Haloferula sargassicola TaxID=490096 RepID=A0ABP9UN63_9BACT